MCIIKNIHKKKKNENTNTQSSNNTFQGHPTQVLENTPSSPAVNEPPSDMNRTDCMFLSCHIRVSE